MDKPAFRINVLAVPVKTFVLPLGYAIVVVCFAFAWLSLALLVGLLEAGSSGGPWEGCIMARVKTIIETVLP